MEAQLRPWLALGFPLGILLAYTAFCGVFRPSTYQLETPVYAAQAVGQDYANLIFVLPVFTVSWFLCWRGSSRALLVHVGVLAYLLYSYSLYAITVRFNSMFLLYTACFGLSLYSMVGILVNIDSEALHTSITHRSPHKRFRICIASLFMFMAAFFYKTWLGEVIPHVLAGTTPQGIIEIGTPSNMVYVLDLGIVLPLLVLTAVWLLSNSRFGYLFAPVILNLSVCMMAALMSMICVMYVKGQTDSLAPAVLFAFLFAVNLAFDTIYLRSVLGNEQELRRVKHD